MSVLCHTSRCFRRLHREQLSSIPSHVLFSSSTIFTPGQAGKRAEDLAQKLEKPLSNIDTLLSHAGVPKGIPNVPLAPPLAFASTYTRPSEGPYNEGDSIYSRMDNPTRRLLESTVYQLECSSPPAGNSTVHLQDYPDMTCAFASGLMAASSIILAHKNNPLTVLLAEDVYHGVSTVLVDVFQERFGVQVKRVNMLDESILEKELKEIATTQTQGSVIVWLETPSNPRCDVIDLAAICQVVEQCRKLNDSISITTVTDSTLAPPTVQLPLEFGVDVVMHSGTKYMGGHSDVLLGITTASPFTEQGRKLGPLIRQTQEMVGGVASPMDSWLTLRGLRTLHVRTKRQCETALKLSQFLESEKARDATLISAVHYPGLESHPKHTVAARQMIDGAYGGVLSVELQSEHLAMAFAGAMRTMHRATSLGGTETLIEHRASIEPEGRVVSPPGLLRISVGLEDAGDLIWDVEQALLITKQVQEEMI